MFLMIWDRLLSSSSSSSLFSSFFSLALVLNFNGVTTRVISKRWLTETENLLLHSLLNSSHNNRMLMNKTRNIMSVSLSLSFFIFTIHLRSNLIVLLLKMLNVSHIDQYLCFSSWTVWKRRPSFPWWQHGNYFLTFEHSYNNHVDWNIHFLM